MSGHVLCDGRVVIGVDDLGRISIALRDADGTVGAHLSLGDVAELEMRLEPGGPLVNVGDLLRRVQ